MSCLQNLKNLQVLYIKTREIPLKSLRKSLGCDERPTLSRLCLPRALYNEEDLLSILELAPKLTHLCIDKRHSFRKTKWKVRIKY